MAVTFRKDHRMLHVGYRKRDWDYVWYQPIFNENEGPDTDEPTLGLYTYVNGRPHLDEFLGEGEVNWLPSFDHRLSESAFKGERFRIQKRFLYNAWKYLDEKNPRRLRQLETELDLGRYVRWQAWFEHAMKWKRQQMARISGARRARMRRRERASQGNGPAADEGQNEQLSVDDSAYDGSENEVVNDEGSDDEQEEFEQSYRDFIAKKPSKTHSNGDRHGHNDDSNILSDTSMPAPKRPRMPASAQASAGASPFSDLFMSGGLGQLTPDPTQNDVGLGSSGLSAAAAKKSSTSSGTSRKKGTSSGKASGSASKRGSEFDDDDAVNAANGGLTDDDALAEAVRLSSTAPE